MKKFSDNIKIMENKEIKFNNVENKSYVVKDGDKEKTIYHNRAVTTNIIQYALVDNEDGEQDLFVIVATRGKDAHDYAGKLNVPCGHLDWNETIEECATRELYEETGYYNSELEIFDISSRITNNRQNVQVTLVSVISVDSIDDLPKLTSTDESSNVHWLDVSELVSDFEIIQQMDNKPESNWAFEHDILILLTTQLYFGLTD